MKKIIIMLFVCVPLVAVSAPSVKVLGAKNTEAVSGAASAAKSTTNAKSAQATPMRAASNVRAKTSNLSGAISGSGSRFPVVTTAKIYPNVNDTSVPTVSGMVVSDDMVNTIVQTVTERVEGNILNNYYNTTEVYNNNYFTQAVRDVDDPRIDAVRTRNPASLHPGVALPSDYIYFWIER